MVVLARETFKTIKNDESENVGSDNKNGASRSHDGPGTKCDSEDATSAPTQSGVYSIEMTYYGKDTDGGSD